MMKSFPHATAAVAYTRFVNSQVNGHVSYGHDPRGGVISKHRALILKESILWPDEKSEEDGDLIKQEIREMFEEFIDIDSDSQN